VKRVRPIIALLGQFSLSGINFSIKFSDFITASNHLLILSNESKMLAEIDLECDKMSYIDLDKLPQTEIVAIDKKEIVIL